MTNKNQKALLLVGAVGAGLAIYFLSKKDKEEKDTGLGGGGPIGGGGFGAGIQPSSDVTYGCKDSDASNYDESATNADDSCTYVEGCTDPSALNFDSEAFLDDGSCEFEGQEVVEPIYGCTDVLATNYNPDATIGNLTCEYPQGCKDETALNYDPEAIVDDGSCEFDFTEAVEDLPKTEYGCTNPAATNYDPLADVDNGSCIIEGCTNPFANNYNPDANSDQGDCEFTEVNPDVQVVYGCTNPAGTNYNSQATNDDGSCIVEGCTAPAASNYDEEANVDNGTCLFDVEEAQEPKTYGCLNPDADNYDPEADFDSGGCIISGCTNSIADNYNSAANFDDGTCIFNEEAVQIPESLVVYGCTDDSANNFNSSATDDDGSCLFSGCTNGLASNYNPSANVEDGSCTFDVEAFAPEDDTNYIFLCGDPNASNTTEQAEGPTGAGSVVVYDVNECEYDQGCTNPTALNFDVEAVQDDGSCVFDGTILPAQPVDFETATLIAENCFNNGLMELTGLLNLLSADLETYGELRDYIMQGGYEPCFSFASETGVLEIVYGCADELALNYEPNTTQPTDTCEYAEGCTNAGATNFDSTAVIDDGSCTFEPTISLEELQGGQPIYGCCDEQALNFSPDAVATDGCTDTCTYLSGCTNDAATNKTEGALVDDGSCTFEATLSLPELIAQAPVYGCMNEIADNWNPEANIDDGSCTYVEVTGCTNSTAIENYDPSHVIDDGSCVFAPLPVGEVVVYGCMDDAASNYNPEANVGMPCTYEGGCTNPDADNYDSTILIDNGGCIFDGLSAEAQANIDAIGTHYYGCGTEGAINDESSAFIPEGMTFHPVEAMCIFPVGCTESTATNFDPSAVIDNGTCLFDTNEALQASETYEMACTDPNANEFVDISQASQDGVNIITNNSLCEYGEKGGCMESEGTLNYDPTATYDDGSCIFEGEDTSVLNPDEFVYGCMNDAATNFNPDANVDDGSCMIEGCTDPAANNTNEFANVEDGSCLYDFEIEDSGVVYGCTNPDAANYDVAANTDNNGCVIEGCTNPDSLTYSPSANFDNGSCEFDVDTSELGLTEYSYVVVCTDPLFPALVAQAESLEGMEGVVAIPNNAEACPYDSLTFGCTDPQAFNYNASSVEDDGSCMFSGGVYPDTIVSSSEASLIVQNCVSSGAWTTNVNSAFLNSAYSTEESTLQELQDLALGEEGASDCYAFVSDYEADEESFTYTDYCPYPSGGGFTADALEALQEAQPNTIFVPNVDECNFTSGGCTNELALNYEFGISQDNGSCIFLGAGPDQIIDQTDMANIGDWTCPTPYAQAVEAGLPISMTLGEFNEAVQSASGESCFEFDSTDYGSIGTYESGCTDDRATNYSPSAVIDDGSCVFPQSAYGCTDSSATNYSPEAFFDDGSCDFTPAVYGCTDPDAINYQQEATADNGSCIYPVLGCTDPEATNFNPNAEEDNGTCEYNTGDEPVWGCTFPQDSNYDPTATIDDGSCLFWGCGKATACNYNPNVTPQTTDMSVCQFCTNPENQCPPDVCEDK